MCSALFALCAAFSLCYVQLLVCGMLNFSVSVMRSIQSVFCAVVSQCYVQFAVTSHVASLQACLASLGRACACIYSKLVEMKIGVQIVLGGRSSKQSANVMRGCLHACMHEFVHAGMRVCVATCVRACMLACFCVCAWMLACMRARMHICMRTCVHGCVHACMHAGMHARMHACMHACMQADTNNIRKLPNLFLQTIAWQTVTSIALGSLIGIGHS